MSNPFGDDAQSARDVEECEGESLCMKIKTQLEDLLSDSHLAEDGFLLKHVQKNKQGYVSLKLLTCLKQIKVLTTNWSTTLSGAERSQLLELNDERTKVRRREPLPKWLLCSPTAKLLLVWNLSAEKTTGEDGEARGRQHPSLSERIFQKFSAYGRITSVWILHPEKEIPKELQCYAKCHKELGQHLSAVVKFDHLEEVREAYNALKAEEESGEGMRVVPLGFQSMHHVTNQPEDTPSQENPLETSEYAVQEEPSAPDKVSDESSDKSTQRELISNGCSQSFSALNQRYSQKIWCSGDFENKNSQCPWVLRCKYAALNPKVALHVNAPCSMQRVLRQPFGPDGTRGFHSRRKHHLY